MAIIITKGFIFARRGRETVKLTAADGVIDFLLDAEELGLVKRGVAEFVKPEVKAEAPTAEETDYSGMSAEELRALAAERGVDLKGAKTKAEKIERLKAAQAAPADELQALRARAEEIDLDISGLGDDVQAIKEAIANQEAE